MEDTLGNVGRRLERTGLLDRLKFFGGTVWVNPDVDRTPGLWATTPEIPLFGLIILSFVILLLTLTFDQYRSLFF